MPGCFRTKDQDETPDDGWPEPPGYLGEAVRRAKRIPSRTERPAPQPETMA